MTVKSKPSRGPALFIRMTEKELSAIEKASSRAGFHHVSEYVRVVMKKVIADVDFPLR